MAQLVVRLNRQKKEPPRMTVNGSCPECKRQLATPARESGKMVLDRQAVRVVLLAADGSVELRCASCHLFMLPPLPD